MKKKDPNQETMQFFEDHAFFKPTVEKEMKDYMDGELERQKAEGIVGADSEKINVSAGRTYEMKLWHRIFLMLAAVVILLLIVCAGVGCVIVSKGGELPAFLGFLEHPIDYVLD